MAPRGSDTHTNEGGWVPVLSNCPGTSRCRAGIENQVRQIRYSCSTYNYESEMGESLSRLWPSDLGRGLGVGLAIRPGLIGGFSVLERPPLLSPPCPVPS